MALREATYVVLCSFFVHFFVNGDIFLVHEASNSVTVFLLSTHAIALLLYPLLGLIADSFFSRYGLIKIATIILLVSSFLLLVLFGIAITLANINSNPLNPMPLYLTGMLAILFISVMLAIGMFEATAVQFGMDQLVDVSSDRLSSFVHWYYLSMNIGIGVMALIVIAVTTVLGSCTIHLNGTSSHFNMNYLNIIAIAYNIAPLLFLQTIFALVSVFVMVCCKQRLVIEPAGHSPFATVYRVLKYAWKHKVPEHRSAFTYWEQDIPSRINLGKSKYGGPFTTEQVEDVKTFFRLLLIIFSLFGFHLSDDGYSVMRQLFYKFCPDSVPYIFIPAAPNILQSITILVCVPLLHYIVLPRFYRYLPNLLHRMGIGLALMFFKDLSGIVIVYSSWYYYGVQKVFSTSKNILSETPIGNCSLNHGHYVFHSNNTTVCTPPETSSHDGGEQLFLWLLIPVVVHTLAYHLVFMTAFEFICAQAPLKMKGLLVSVWYAMSSLQYFVVGTFSRFITIESTWLIAHGVKAMFILLSLIMHCSVSRCYYYRQRDEIVNEHYLVEEIYERRLRQAEEFEREERRHLINTSHSASYTDVPANIENT